MISPPLNRAEDLVGRRFGRLTVVSIAPKRRKLSYLLCECSCGATNVEVYLGNLTQGKTNSCGCLRRDMTALRNTTHAKSQLVEYQIWCHIIGRCGNKNNPAFASYGGRGIQVCPRWRNSFLSFLADMGPRPKGRWTIERIDNNRGYRSSNCRWATYQEQGQNTRRTKLNSELVLYIKEARSEGKRSYSSLAKELGVSKSCIAHVCSGRVWRNVE